MARKKANESEDIISSDSNISTRDELATLISKNLSKTFKDSVGAIWYLDGPEDSPSDVIDWISTGSSLLDLAISNRPHGGIPVGRITEFTGLEGSGKSLVAAHALVDTQRKNGVAVFIDTEAAVDRAFLTAIGVDLSKMMYIPLETIEDIFQAIENIINTVRNNEKSKLVTIVVDSLAGASTKVEMDADFDKDGYATTKAILLSKAMRKINNLIAKEKVCLIFTNQLRQKLNAMAFADPWTTSGGKAVAFHSSVRVRLSSTGALKKKDFGGVDMVVGNKVDAKVIKNRIGPPQRKASFEVFYNSGIDNYSGWVSVLKTYKFITQAGAYNKYKLLDGDGNTIEELQFKTANLPELLSERPELWQAMYDNLCNIMIMKYEQNGKIRMDEDIDIDEKDQSGAE